jgi:acyl-CoA thioesterase FadM
MGQRNDERVPQNEHQDPAPANGANVVIERRIEWMDTDAAGQHHNTAIMRLVESAEAALHRNLGIVDETFGRTPRVRAETNFRGRLRFDDLVRVELRVDDVGRTSLRYGFAVHRGRELVADGALVIVRFDTTREVAVEWPVHQRALLLGRSDRDVRRSSID